VVTRLLAQNLTPDHWYAIRLEPLVRDAHYDHDEVALARCLDALDRLAA
jgi:hypothetical protein